MKLRFNPLVALGCLSLITVSATHAADRIKANNTTALNLDGSWTTTAPLATDIGVWDGTVTAANSSPLNAAATWQGIRIVNPGGAITTGGTSLLTLTPDIGVLGIDMSAATNNLTISGPVALGSEQTWNVASGRTLNAAGVVSGGFLLTKTGTGQLTLGAQNTLSSGIQLSEGILTINSQGSLGTATGDFIIKAATTIATSAQNGTVINVAKPIKLDGSFTYTVQGTTSNGLLHLGSGPVTLGDNITVTNASGVLAMSGDMGGSFGLTKAGAGTLALLGSLDYTGQTTVANSSNLRVATPTSFPGTNIFLDGGVIELGGTFSADNALVLGTNPGQVRFKTGLGPSGGAASHGGVASASGYRRISFTSEGVPNAPLVWGTTPHFISGGSTSSGIFLMGTPQGAGTVDLTNAIDFAGVEHRFSVRDGAAVGAPDAVLSGQLTNGVLSSQGTGTLFISNPNNTLTGTTRVTGGSVLRVPAIAGYLGTSNVVLDGGTLELPPGTQVSRGTGAGQVSIVNAGGFSTYGTSNSPISIGAPTDTVLFSDLVPTSGSALLLSGASSGTSTTFANPIDLGDSVQNFNVANGLSPIDAELAGVISNGGLTMTGGGGALYLSNPNNSYSQATTLNAGALVVNVLANGGLNSSIGASANDPFNWVFNGGGLRYVGTGNTTDRLFTMSNNATINSSGTGPLDFTNPGDHQFTGSTARTLSLTGLYDGENQFRGKIANSGASTNISKYGHTGWTLSGDNSFGGTVEVQLGTLTADYSGGKNPLGSTSQVTLNSGNLVLKGGSTNVVRTLTAFRLSSGNLALTNNLVLDSANGSPGIQLTLTTLNGNPTSANTMLSNLFDISSNPLNSITAPTLANNLAVFPKTGASTTAYDVVMMSNRTNLVIKESTGYGFAYQNGSKQLKALPISDGVVVTPDSGTNTNNLRLTYEDTVTAGTPGSVTRTLPLKYGTLALDSSGGSVTLDLGANVLGSGTAAENGRGILITGTNAANSVTLTGTTPMITSGTNAGYSPFIYNYSKGDFNLGMPVDAGISLILGGTGMINLTGEIVGSSVKIYANGCHLRLSADSNLGVLSFNSGMWVSGGGILEIGNNLTANPAIDFAQGVGNGDSQIRFIGDSGISAHGGTRVANFGGSSETLVWGSNYFLTNSGGTDNDAILLLSSTRSDSTLDIKNPISLNQRDRVIKVARGATTPTGVADAVLSGEISGPGAGIIKRGLGILALDGDNSYTGATVISSGVLRFMKPTLADSSTVRIASGAQIDLSHGQTDVIGALIVNGSPVAPKIYGAADLPGVITGLGKLNVGGAPVTQTPFELWADQKNLPVGKKGPSDDADNDGLLNLLEYAVASEPLQPGGSVLSKVTNGVSFRRALGRTDITSVVETSPNLAINSWTIVATSTAGGPFVAQSGATVTVNDSQLNADANSVTVTDTTTPVPTRKFYRLRVTQNTPIP